MRRIEFELDIVDTAKQADLVANLPQRAGRVGIRAPPRRAASGPSGRGSHWPVRALKITMMAMMNQLPIWNGEHVAGFIDLALERAFIYRTGEASEQVEIPPE